MAKKRKVVAPRRFDTTQCKESMYEKYVHRDYFAHCMRWSWVSRLVKAGMSVLDVGCGQDAPMAKVLSRTAFPMDKRSRYVGVDMNKGVKGHGKTWCEIREEFDFTSRYAELGQFDAVVNLEVIEHMEVEDGKALLRGMRECLAPDGRLYLSTPVFYPSVGAAANHIHEYTIPELKAQIEECGLEVEARRGTFGNYPVIKKALTPEHLAVYEALREFHGDDVMACFMSPLYPDAARNNFWILRRAH